jgi:hypothetical protein
VRHKHEAVGARLAAIEEKPRAADSKVVVPLEHAPGF